ncbi:hypothetical protein ACFYM2_33885 [Streptomyces sp. NPDC006711]|uniref:hypothetical protein n=1 Tax=Streptomyces sp. NPDC006711 TaxID=3364762 RepID=UPI0036D1EF2C
MGAMVLCAVFWAGAAAAVIRCVQQWRSGADRVWSSKWKTLAGALVVTAFPVMATARVVSPDAPFLMDLAGLLVLGSAGSLVAGWVAARRSNAQARAMRSGLGLPVERRLWSPWVLSGLWSAAGIPFTAAAVVITTRYIEAHSEPAADGTWAEADMVAWLAVLTIAAFVVIGTLHGLLQHRRRTREQQRVRHAEQQYLTTNPAD